MKNSKNIFQKISGKIFPPQRVAALNHFGVKMIKIFRWLLPMVALVSLLTIILTLLVCWTPGQNPYKPMSFFGIWPFFMILAYIGAILGKLGLFDDEALMRYELASWIYGLDGCLFSILFILFAPMGIGALAGVIFSLILWLIVSLFYLAPKLISILLLFGVSLLFYFVCVRNTNPDTYNKPLRRLYLRLFLLGLPMSAILLIEAINTLSSFGLLKW